MKSTKNLRLRLRLIEGALALLIGALTTGAIATHQLLLDATNLPTSDVSFSGSHWIGTLDAARLPADINPASIGATTPGAGTFTTLSATGFHFDPVASAASQFGGYIDTTNGGCINTNTGGSINTAGGGNIITLAGGSIDTSFDGGSITTTYGGGSIQTNGSGSPNDNGISAPIGSIYMDQDINSTSGHVMWVMEANGWSGK